MCCRNAPKSITEAEWEEKKRQLLFSSIIQRLTSLLAGSYPSIADLDADRDVTVQTHWVRGGDTTPPDTFCQVNRFTQKKFN